MAEVKFSLFRPFQDLCHTKCIVHFTPYFLCVSEFWIHSAEVTPLDLLDRKRFPPYISTIVHYILITSTINTSAAEHYIKRNIGPLTAHANIT